MATPIGYVITVRRTVEHRVHRCAARCGAANLFVEDVRLLTPSLHSPLLFTCSVHKLHLYTVLMMQK